MILQGRVTHLIGGDKRYRGVRVRVNRRIPPGDLGHWSIKALKFDSLDAACCYVDASYGRGQKP